MYLSDTMLRYETFENDVIISSVSKFLEFTELLICEISVGALYMEL